MSDLENLTSNEDLEAPIGTTFNTTKGELSNEVPEGEETSETVEDPEIEEARKIIEKLEKGEGGNTDEIKKLTPELAERLVTLANNTDDRGSLYLDLDGLTEISEGVAEKLATFNGDYLYLNGLTEISEGVAEKFSALKGDGRSLYLNGLREISEGAAEKLSTAGCGYLYLDGLTGISEGAAEKLSVFVGYVLSLNGLTEISEGVAEKLVAFNGSSLLLNGLTEISEGAAEKLASFKGDDLSLNGLIEISEGVAENLSARLSGGETQYLFLNGLTGIRKGVAKLIELNKGTLFFNGIKGVSDNINSDIVAEIGLGTGVVHFGGISELNEGLARVIGSFQGILYLDGIRSINWDISDEIVEAMSTCPGGNIHMAGVSELNEGLAKVIGSFNGLLFLNGIKKIDGNISNEVVEAMSTCPGNIYMDGIYEMSMSLSKIISKFQGHLNLTGIKNSKGISDAEMANIVKCPGYFCLGVTAIDKEFGKKIAGFEGKGLSLPGVKEIDDETAETLIPIKDKFKDGSVILAAIKRVEKKIEMAKKANEKFEGLRQEIKETKPKEDWDGKRGDKIEYDRKSGEIKSWGKGTKVEEIGEDKIKLEGLDLELTKEEAMWLANFKNMVKREFGGREVEYTRGVRNKSFAYRKTLYVGNTVLIKRKKLNEHIPSCEDDEVVEKIKDWLNS